eukprot:m51a1_g13024 hypothetical protein (462) ;mRNA; r:1019-2678
MLACVSPATLTSAATTTRAAAEDMLEQAQTLLSDLAKCPPTNEFIVSDARAIVCDSLARLAETVLSSYCDELQGAAATPRAQERYEQVRRRALAAVCRGGAIGQAHQLCLKFRELRVLIDVCEGSPESDALLDEYLEQYRSAGFPELVYAHWLKAGKARKILAQPRSRDDCVTAFLASRPDLLWLRHASMGRHADAARVLIGEARKPCALSQRRELASMCKLCALAALGDDGEGGDDAELRACVDASEHLLFAAKMQEALARATGEEPGTALQPIEIARRLLEADTTGADVETFKNALDLSAHCSLLIPDEQAASFEREVWTRALCSYDWVELAKRMQQMTESQLENSVQGTAFYQLILRVLQMPTVFADVDDWQQRMLRTVMQRYVEDRGPQSEDLKTLLSTVDQLVAAIPRPEMAEQEEQEEEQEAYYDAAEQPRGGPSVTPPGISPAPIITEDAEMDQ